MRPTPLVLFVLSALLVPATAHSGPGLGLRWIHCYGDAGVANRVFACNVNTGTERLCLSFTPPVAMSELIGVEIVLDVTTSGGANLPSWWQAFNQNTCRQTAIRVSEVDDVDAVHCMDTWSGQGASLIDYTTPAAGGPSTARLRIATAVPITAPASVDPSQEYFADVIIIAHAKSIGTGSCRGCLTPMCFWLESMNLVQPAGVGDYLLADQKLAGDVNSNLASWQNGTPILIPESGSPLACELPVSARTRTWGAIKSLYR